MRVIHISAECYPAAKSGGLGDVVGALPKYLTQSGVDTSVILPKYGMKWINSQHWSVVYAGKVRLRQVMVPFTIEEHRGPVDLGYRLFVANIPGFYDRNGIYADDYGGFGDEVERYILFQQTALQWIAQFGTKPQVIHCHDHHTGLVPFMMKHCPEYWSLSQVPSIFTIHNGNYQGAFSWKNMSALPIFEAKAAGLLDWNDTINPMAAGIKCSWAFTTVSQSYMEEMRGNSMGLEPLIRTEWGKSLGILNGIDVQTWNPATDPMLATRFDGDVNAYKAANKKVICERFGLDPFRPLFSFIGRLVGEKGADLLPDAFEQFINEGDRGSVALLGTGEQHLHHAFGHLAYQYQGTFGCSLAYNETLSHQIYAGADFLLMPSRVEPCGLNQMYAQRYGTVPIVRRIGGLKDTVHDISMSGGTGITFDQLRVGDIVHAMHRAADMYEHWSSMTLLRQRMMGIDHSWEHSTATYTRLYERISGKKLH